jgi:hypothetical protein
MSETIIRTILNEGESPTETTGIMSISIETNRANLSFPDGENYSIPIDVLLKTRNSRHHGKRVIYEISRGEMIQ